ncbi:component of IIS longevity pathway SMK-1-domain-containing protein, partial [Amylostereum chailletii]
MTSAPRYWLMKAEPNSRVEKGKDVKFSVDDFESVKTTQWEGVRNHEAKNHMKSMSVGDKVLFYHSNCKVPGIAGFAEVSKEAYPDCTCGGLSGSDWRQLTKGARLGQIRHGIRGWGIIRDHPYYDAKTDQEKPRWYMVDVTFTARATHFVPYPFLRDVGASGSAEPPEGVEYIGVEGVAAIKGMELVRRGRLSVQKVEAKAFETIEKMAGRGGWTEGEGKRNIIHFSHDSAPDDFPNTSHKGFVVIDGPPQHQLLDVPSHDPMNAHSAGQEAIIVMESGDENQQWYQEGDNHELKRVKVYELVSSRWVDQGTAFCFGHYDEPTSEALLIARAETDYNNVILQTTIRSSDVYQRQQDTLIVWTEPDGVDFALSFQDPDGCSEVWNFITEVQRIHSTISGEHCILSVAPFLTRVEEEQHGESSSPFSGPEPSITTASIIRSGHLPQPALGIIPEIDRAIKTLSRTASIKEKICEYIQRADYLKAMIDVMHQAEDLESLENLHPLCMLMQTILMMNDHSMYEHIIEDDIFFGVIGMLEYDPEFPDHKANYREFLRESTHFHQPVPVHEPAIEKKIHHTYRLQFLKDVVLARALDDSTFNVLNSCIIFNQIDILSHVQNHPQFLKGITNLFVSEDGSAAKKDGVPMDVDPTDADKPKRNGAPSGANGVAEVPSKSPDQDEASLPQRRREVVLLIQQLCIMGKNVQLPTRMALFKLIVDRGVVHAIQWALSLPETTPEGQQMIAVAGEVFMTLLDHDVNGVREHIVRQCEQNTASGAKDESLLLSLCAIMVRSRDLAVQTLVGDALRMLLEMPIADSNEAIVPSKLFSRARDDAKVEKFLDYFYKLCISTLLKPIFDIPDRKQASDWILGLTREKTNLYLSLCDLLSTFALQHSFRSHFFMLTTNTSAHVATLLLAKDKHLRLAALRYFRAHLKNKNRNFLAHLMKVDLFKPILELSLFESRRDTLVNSSCQEFFEYMRRENVKEAIAHVMTTQEALVKQLSETRYSGQCFTALIRRWEMNTAPQPLEEEEKPPP